eukprot:gene11814-13038_t
MRSFKLHFTSHGFEGMLENFKSNFRRKPLSRSRGNCTFLSERQLFSAPQSSPETGSPTRTPADKYTRLDEGCSSVSTTMPVIVQEGHLRMQRRSLRKTCAQTWKEMYVVLNESHLNCYRRKGDQVPKQVIVLDESVGIYPEDMNDKHRSHCIKISTKSINYTMCAADECERDVWLTMLLTVISEKLLNRSESRNNLNYNRYTIV